MFDADDNNTGNENNTGKDTTTKVEAAASSTTTPATPTAVTQTLPTTTATAPNNSNNNDPPPMPTVSTKTPKATLRAVYKAGIYKAGLTLNLLSVQCFMAGVYIAMAGQLSLSVGGGVLGAVFFPTGLIAVVLTSAELFTGDALIFVASVLGGQVSWKKLVRNWTVAWTMNFVGSVVWAAALAYGSNALEDLGQRELAIKVALKKAHQPFFRILLKGVGANFMVCVGIWQATCAEEVAGKVLALWFPISAFVMMGFEHAIANQFFIPLGMMYGADISVYELFIEAMLPATIGNVIGGGVFVGAVYWYVFDTMTTHKRHFSRIRQVWGTAKTASHFFSMHGSAHHGSAHRGGGDSHDDLEAGNVGTAVVFRDDESKND